MKGFTLTLILCSILIAPSITLAKSSEKGEGVNASVLVKETKTWSIGEHLAAVKQHQQEAQKIEARIQDLESRISNLNDKPYFDPKGFHRSHSKSLLTTLEGELNELQELIAWHHQHTNQAKNY